MKKLLTLGCASRALMMSAIGVMAFSTASVNSAAAQDRQNSASSSSSISASIEGRPGESYEIVSKNGTSKAFHILTTGDRLEVPLTENSDGGSQIILGDGQIIDVSKNGSVSAQSSSEYTDGSGATRSYSSNSGINSESYNYENIPGFSERFGNRSGETNNRSGSSDRVKSMREMQRERLKSMRERQQKALDEMAAERRERQNGSADGNAGTPENYQDYRNRGSRYNYGAGRYNGEEGRQRGRERMNEMRERLMARSGASNWEDMWGGSSSGNMATAQRSVDRAMRQLEALQENGNASPELKKALRDLKSAQKTLDKANPEPGNNSE